MSTPAPGTAEGPAPARAPRGLLDTIRMLRASGGALLDQAAMYADLLCIEWTEEKQRLQQVLLTTLFGFACLLCSLLFAGALVLATTWDTAWRIPSAALLVGFYLTGLGLAWYRLHGLAARSDRAFAATREELAADIELLRSKL